ncbi:MAG: hypothetical protein QJR02_11515 [Sinobacteraceae bacterium]|nr:hypothetical protein [Nevskiaceae bacterium]
METKNHRQKKHVVVQDDCDGSDGYAPVDGPFDGPEALIRDARAGHKTVIDFLDAATQARLKGLSERWGVSAPRIVSALIEDAAEDLTRNPEYHPDALMAKGIEKLEGSNVESVDDLPFFQQKD